MNKHILSFTAAIFVVNGMTGSRIFGQAQPADRQPGANTTVDRAAGPAAGVIADNGVREQNAIQDALGKAVSAALSDKLSDLNAVVTDADRERLGDKLDGQDAQIADQITQLKKFWQSKYNQEFNIKSEQLAFGTSGLRIRPGSASDNAARAASDRIDPVDSPMPIDQKVTPGNAVDHGDAPARTQPESADATNTSDSNLGNSVTAVIPAAKGSPEVNVALVRQSLGTEWKLDLPDGVDGNQLKINLQHALSGLLADQQNWPGEVKDGYRIVAHRTLAALENVRPANSADSSSSHQP